MNRTNAQDVAQIFDTSLDDGAGQELEAWIEIAHEIVDDIAAADPSLSSTRLEQIEKLLAAHLASTQDQRHARDSGASRSVSYQGETGMGIDGTKYGQQAKALDPTGTLANMGKPAASVGVPNVKDIGDETDID